MGLDLARYVARYFTVATSYKTFETGIYKRLDDRPKPYLWRQRINGQKMYESFATLREAKEKKREVMAKIAKYGQLATDYRLEDWRDLAEARDILPDGVSIADAARYYVERMGDGKGQYLADCYHEFLDYQAKRGNVKSYIRALKARVGRLVAEFPDTRIGEIDREMLLKALQGLSGKLSPRSIRNYRNDWNNFFEHFIGNGISANPVKGIGSRHLPKVSATVEKHPLELPQVVAIMAFVESELPELSLWFALQFFLGFREAEASRFQHEWIQADLGRVVIPGSGTKTGDLWALDTIPDNFWYWHRKYGQPSGKVVFPKSSWHWSTNVLGPMISSGVIDNWPHNAKRDTFCTFHISAYRDPQMTALMLKHRNANTLWQSYMGCLKSEIEGRAYFQIYPDAKTLKGLSS